MDEIIKNKLAQMKQLAKKSGKIHCGNNVATKSAITSTCSLSKVIRNQKEADEFMLQIEAMRYLASIGKS